LDDINNYLKNTDDSADADNLDILCSFLKEYIKDIGDSYTCPIHNAIFKGRAMQRSLSSSNVDEFDMKLLISSIAQEKKNDLPNESIRELFFQNIRFEEEILKIMVVSNDQDLKSELLTKFINNCGHIEQPPAGYI
jgi:hypothetical protein